MTRDPRTDPQPGDEVRDSSGELRRAVKREGDKVLVEGWGKRYWCGEGHRPAKQE